jgi:hypothetical protein
MGDTSEEPGEMTLQPFNKKDYCLDNDIFEYCIKQLLSIIGIECNTDAQDNTLSLEDLKITYIDHPIHFNKNPSIIIRKCNFSTLINNPDGLVVSWMDINELIPRKGIKEPIQKIPIITTKNDEFQTKMVEIINGNTVIFNFDIIAITFFMFSRIEEFGNKDLDKRGRFKAKNCLAYKLGFLEYPIVDEYAIILREWIKYLVPDINIESKEFKTLVTHDIDHVYKKENIIDGGQNMFKDPFNLYHNIEENPYYLAINNLIDRDIKRGYKSIYYLMTATKTEYDDGYELNSVPLLKIVDRLKTLGLTIGLHSSYMAVDDYGLLIQEKSNLERITNLDCKHIRQHYIRFNMPETWNEFSQAGFDYDSSLLYREFGGFRFGTCHPFKVFDARRRKALNLIEMPVVIMDVHLWNAEYSDEDRLRIVLNLKERCQSVNGVYTVIVHNDTLIDNPNIGKIIYDTL